MKKIAVTVLLFAAIFSTSVFSQDSIQIPQWLAESETYGFKPNLEDIAGTSWKFITHCPDTAEFLGEAKRRGIRAFPYITFYQLSMHTSMFGLKASDHPEWILINKSGKWVTTTFWEAADGRNTYCTCPNVKEYRDATLAYVETLMKRGAHGVFLDNILAPRKCYGQQFGKHKHMFENQNDAFIDFLKQLRALIKKYEPDGALLINSGEPLVMPKEYWPHIDCDMAESFICTLVSSKRLGTWEKDWTGIDKKIPPGRQVCCLSYPGYTTYPLKDDLYFCYASARLMNFIWSAGEKYNKNLDARKLFALTLGQPAADEVVVNRVHYRRFFNGIVAVNPTDQEQTIQSEGSFTTSAVLNVYNDEVIMLKDGKLNLTIPAQSGRVWLYKPISKDYAEETDYRPYKLTIKTQPLLGDTWFEVDGIDLVTFAGYWKVEYDKTARFGTVYINFDNPGTHTVKIKNESRREMRIPNSGFGDPYVLNDIVNKKEPILTVDINSISKLVNPANPPQPPKETYRFTGWDGATKGKDKEIKVEVNGHTEIIAIYEAE